MKRFIIILVLIFTSFRLFAQEITYKPVFIDQCKDSLVQNSLWWISDSNYTSYNLVDHSSTSVILPKLGKYFLNLEIGEEPEIINIEKYGETIDTFYTKRVHFPMYINKPLYSSFLDCDSWANGLVTDFYYNGNIRLTCNFSNGKPIDSLKKYYSSGVMQELYIPFLKHRQHIFYYKNGQIRIDYNSAKRYSKEYFESGELKKEEFWNRKYHTKKKHEYYKNGQLKHNEHKKCQIRYFSNGFIKNQTTRKEVLILERIFTKYGTPWFDYQCNLWDSLGNKLAFIQYSGFMFPSGNFPDSISQIKEYQFNEILLYKNGQELIKVGFTIEKEGSDFIDKLIIYEKKDDIWIEKEITTVNNVYKILERHLQSNAL